MTDHDNSVNKPASIAPLKNVTLFNELCSRLVARPPGSDGIGVWYGMAGLGKTYAANFGANKVGAFYLEMGPNWSVNHLLDCIYHEIAGGKPVSKNIAAKTEEVITNLAEHADQPLIIDEADFAVTKRLVDTLRDIHQKSSAPLILIGEERLPGKLQNFERAHSRVYAWKGAVPADLEDAGHLVRLYCPEIGVADDLLEHLVKVTHGSARRIKNNIDRMKEVCRQKNLTSIDLATWGDRTFDTGKPPAPRNLEKTALRRVS